MWEHLLGPAIGVGGSLLGGIFGNDDSPARAPEMISSTWTPQKGAEAVERMRAEGINPFSAQGTEYLNAAIAAERENDPRFGEYHLKQLPEVGKSYYNPFITAGRQSQGLVDEQYNKMAQNPQNYLDQIISGYKPSQGYQFREKRALDAARNSAAQGGLTGTYNDQTDQAQLVNDIMGGDIQQYLANVLGIQGAGLQGHENTINRGLNASSNLASFLGNSLGARAGLSRNREMQENAAALDFQNAQQDYNRQQNQSLNNMFGSILGGLGNGLGDLANSGGIRQTPPYVKPTRSNPAPRPVGGQLGLTQPTSAFNPQSIYGGFR